MHGCSHVKLLKVRISRSKSRCPVLYDRDVTSFQTLAIESTALPVELSSLQRLVVSSYLIYKYTRFELSAFRNLVHCSTC